MPKAELNCASSVTAPSTFRSMDASTASDTAAAASAEVSLMGDVPGTPTAPNADDRRPTKSIPLSVAINDAMTSGELLADTAEARETISDRPLATGS